MTEDDPVRTCLQRDLEASNERKRRLEAGELPFVDAPGGQPPEDFDRKREIVLAEAKKAELSEELRKFGADRT